MNCIGVDVHQTSTFGAVVREGREVFRFEMKTQAETLKQTLGGIKGAKRVAVEEGNLSDWCKRTLEGVVNEGIICDPRWNRLISEGEDKVDAVDAYRLGLLVWLNQLGNGLTQTGQLLIQQGKAASVVRRNLNRNIVVIAWSMMKDPQPYREEVCQESNTIN